MEKINIDKLPRKKTYEWFKSFEYSTYGITKTIDVSSLVKHAKENHESFFIDMLYLITTSLNSVPEFRMRLVDNEPVIYEDINPAITVMTENESFENVRFENSHNFKTFYEIAKKHIEPAKKANTLSSVYNPTDCWSEFYITCLPWIDFTGMTHPIPKNQSSQTVPRICWGKYYQDGDKYKMSLNITVSHIFIDGLHLSKAFNKIEESLNNIEELLK